MPKTPEEIAAEQAAADAEKTKGEGKDTTDEVVEPDPVEVAARAEGWKPKENFDGDPDMWVDAKGFLERKPLFKVIRNQSKSIKELNRKIDAMTNKFGQTVNIAVKARLAELQTAKNEAIKEGDVERVAVIDKAIDEQRGNQTDDASPEIPEEITRWVEENPWYEKDRELHDFALAFNDVYLRKHPGDLAGSLEETTKAVKKAFPEKFGGGRVAPVANTVEGAGKTAPRGVKKLSVSRLNSEQRLIHDQYVKSGVLTSEEYLKGLEEIGELP